MGNNNKPYKVFIVYLYNHPNQLTHIRNKMLIKFIRVN